MSERRLRSVPRASDEMLLEMIHQRCFGNTTARIGLALGVDQREVSRRTNEVRAADLEHPDPRHAPDDIAGAYW
jgi:hypothetical protein